uniref:Ig-like domain-containing protein n=1 Tax=Poecilia latipinna TaxID=48699 RepID=A0A3B3U571_9TELE
MKNEIKLQQPQSSEVKRPGDTVKISCFTSGYTMTDYSMTHWIRQPAGKGLEWIGYMCSGCTGARKDSLKNKFTITVQASSKTVTLNGQNLQPEDSAVYYCARDSHYWGPSLLASEIPTKISTTKHKIASPREQHAVQNIK